MRNVETIGKLRELLNPVEESLAEAAVAMLLSQAEAGLRVLLVKRAVNPSDPWSGHMALPGGRRCPEDHSIMETVVRETIEETGIDISQFLFLGTLNVVTSNVAPDLEILPFVVLSEETPKVTLTKELCSYFWVSLEQLKRSKGRGRAHQRNVPAYLVQNEVVWGLTYRMLNNLLDLVEVVHREV